MKKIILLLMMIVVLIGCGSQDTSKSSKTLDNDSKEVTEIQHDEKDNSTKKDSTKAQDDDKNEENETDLKKEQTQAETKSSSKKETSAKKDEEVKKTDSGNVDKKQETKSEQLQTNQDTSKKEELSPLKESPSQTEKEETKLSYQIENSGKLFNSEDEANIEAERQFNNFDDPEKYVSGYMVYSTFDKWTISYTYTYY